MAISILICNVQKIISTIGILQISSKEERNITIKRNIIISAITKATSIAISFIMIPLSISYLNPIKYGVWLTISSVITWLTFFDVGLGNGLKNKLAEVYYEEDKNKAKEIVSTTYAILAIISLSMLIITLSLTSYLNLTSILNIPKILAKEIRLGIQILLIIFSLQFIVQTINNVLYATQRAGLVSSIATMGQLLSLVGMLVLLKFGNSSIPKLILITALLPVITQLFASIYLFKSTFKQISPNMRMVNFKLKGELLNIGGVFFLIQIGTIVLLQTDNILIARLLGPEEVTLFNVSYKYFSIIIIAFTIIITPYWSAYSEASIKKDYQWMRSSYKKLKNYWLISMTVAFIMLLMSKLIYKFWLNNGIEIPITISICMAIYMIGYTWIMLHCYILNGLGKLRLQLYLYIFSTITNIPLGIYLEKEIGLEGIILSNIIIFVCHGIVLNIQCNKNLNQKAHGIWLK